MSKLDSTIKGLVEIPGDLVTNSLRLESRSKLIVNGGINTDSIYAEEFSELYIIGDAHFTRLDTKNQVSVIIQGSVYSSGLIDIGDNSIVTIKKELETNSLTIGNDSNINIQKIEIRGDMTLGRGLRLLSNTIRVGCMSIGNHSKLETDALISETPSTKLNINKLVTIGSDSCVLVKSRLEVSHILVGARTEITSNGLTKTHGLWTQSRSKIVLKGPYETSELYLNESIFIVLGNGTTRIRLLRSKFSQLYFNDSLESSNIYLGSSVLMSSGSLTASDVTLDTTMENRLMEVNQSFRHIRSLIPDINKNKYDSLMSEVTQEVSLIIGRDAYLENDIRVTSVCMDDKIEPLKIHGKIIKKDIEK